jgi:hypothetical protein
MADARCLCLPWWQRPCLHEMAFRTLLKKRKDLLFPFPAQPIPHTEGFFLGFPLQ